MIQSVINAGENPDHAVSIPYAIVMGDKEVAEQNISVRERNLDESSPMSIEQFAKKIRSEIAGKKFDL